MNKVQLGHLKTIRDNLLVAEDYLRNTTAPDPIVDGVGHALDHLEEILGIGAHQTTPR